MVEGRLCPASGCVTRATVDGESAAVRVILQMAILALHHWFQLGVERVAFLAIHIHVLAIQFERGQVVVERGRNPRVHAVALHTVRAEAEFVRLVVSMAGEAVARRGLQIRQFARVGVATVTVHLHMRARQRERNLAMVKMFVVGVHAIVTGQAVSPPTQRVSLRKGQVEVAMTFNASGRIEIRQAFSMAIFAHKWLIREGQFVTA